MVDEQFCDIGPHGTKIIVFNLWSNGDGNLELDFDTNPEVTIKWFNIIIAFIVKVTSLTLMMRLLEYYFQQCKTDLINFALFCWLFFNK
jgi:hypothetical protein